MVNTMEVLNEKQEKEAAKKKVAGIQKTNAE